MSTIFPALINISYLQLLDLLHPYLLLGICLFNICSFIFISFPWWDIWETSHGLFPCTPIVLSFFPKNNTTMTPQSMTICSNVTNNGCMFSTWLICWNFHHFFDQLHVSMIESVLVCTSLSSDLQIFLLMCMKHSSLVEFFYLHILGIYDQTHCMCSISMCDMLKQHVQLDYMPTI